MSTNNGQDEDWLRAIFEQWEDRLVRYASRAAGNLEWGRDIVQDAFVKLCCEPNRPKDNVSAWLFTVCRNRAKDILKKERRMHSVSLEDREGLLDRSPEPPQMAELREDVELARSMLKQLSPNQQEVISLKIEHGLSYREISEITGLSVTNVGFLLHQGLKILRSKMNSLER
jgi:RNA polymerase sigma-70 factor (ECF subfamily)